MLTRLGRKPMRIEYIEQIVSIWNSIIYIWDTQGALQ